MPKPPENEPFDLQRSLRRMPDTLQEKLPIDGIVESLNQLLVPDILSDRYKEKLGDFHLKRFQNMLLQCEEILSHTGQREVMVEELPLLVTIVGSEPWVGKDMVVGLLKELFSLLITQYPHVHAWVRLMKKNGRTRGRMFKSIAIEKWDYAKEDIVKQYRNNDQDIFAADGRFTGKGTQVTSDQLFHRIQRSARHALTIFAVSPVTLEDSKDPHARVHAYSTFQALCALVTLEKRPLSTTYTDIVGGAFLMLKERKWRDKAQVESLRDLQHDSFIYGKTPPENLSDIQRISEGTPPQWWGVHERENLLRLDGLFEGGEGVPADLQALVSHYRERAVEAGYSIHRKRYHQRIARILVYQWGWPESPDPKQQGSVDPKDPMAVELTERIWLSLVDLPIVGATLAYLLQPNEGATVHRNDPIAIPSEGSARNKIVQSSQLWDKKT